MNNPVGDKLTVRELLDKAADRLDGQTEPGRTSRRSRPSSGPSSATPTSTSQAHAKAEPHYRRAGATPVPACSGRTPGHPGRPEPPGLRGREPGPVGGGRCRWPEGPRRRATGCSGSSPPGDGRGGPQSGRGPRPPGEVRTRPSPCAVGRVRIFNAALGPDHNKTLEADNDLAVVLVNAGRPAEAVVAPAVRRRPSQPGQPAAPGVARPPSVTWGALDRTGPIRGRRDAAPRRRRPEREDPRGRTYPRYVSAPEPLGLLLGGPRRWTEAEANYLAVLADRRRVAAERPRIS